MLLRNPPVFPMAQTPMPAMSKGAKPSTAPRHTQPGTQPRSGPPMPPDPVLTAPKSNKPHHRATSLAKSKTTKGKHVIPPPQYGTRAKPKTEY